MGLSFHFEIPKNKTVIYVKLALINSRANWVGRFRKMEELLSRLMYFLKLGNINIDREIDRE